MIKIILITAKDIEVYPTPNVVTALENENIVISVTVEKDIDGNVYCQLVANGNTVGLYSWFMTEFNRTLYFAVTMPPTDLNLTINCGHQE
jgi:hypothetical protein